jgi:hypothetical protein
MAIHIDKFYSQITKCAQVQGSKLSLTITLHGYGWIFYAPIEPKELSTQALEGV